MTNDKCDKYNSVDLFVITVYLGNTVAEVYVLIIKNKI